ncbi:MAG TPA: DoxX family protein [Daejeonella sp.]|nr:DoxX family protein [Daejeonella sp.]
MNTVQKIEHWGDIHHGKWLDYLRIVVGITLILKGIAFVSDGVALRHLFLHNNVYQFSGLMAMALDHFVAFAHISGGILITIGLVTRFASVVQIPILLCAVFLVNVFKGFTPLNSELWFSVIMLMLVILFWVVGSGPFSVDYWMKTHRSK